MRDLYSLLYESPRSRDCRARIARSPVTESDLDGGRIRAEELDRIVDRLCEEEAGYREDLISLTAE